MLVEMSALSSSSMVFTYYSKSGAESEMILPLLFALIVLIGLELDVLVLRPI